MSFSIKGKTAIVTGAANGIGLAIARHFIDQGANVMLADIDEDKLCMESNALGSEQAQCFGGDLSQKLTIANLQSATIDAFDRVDILVNASRQVLPTDPLDVKEDSVDVLFQKNVLANLRLTRSVAKLMLKQAKQTQILTLKPSALLSILAQLHLKGPNPICLPIRSAVPL